MFGHPTWIWLVLGAVLLPMLALDLLAHRGGEPEPKRRAIAWSAAWITVGLLFGVFVWSVLGPDAAGEYLAAYLIEKSLSLDNIFVFLTIFQALCIPQQSQRRVLLWGVLGALGFRAIFILAGAEALERWRWVSYVFGAILLWTAARIAREDPSAHKEPRTVRWLAQHIPVTHELHGPSFFVVERGRRVATPLLVALVGLELTDIVFAVDSVPAALAITRDRFIVYSSNAFAILGLRSLYVVLSQGVAELEHLHYGLAAVLAFAALKLMTAGWLHVPPLLSVAIIATLLGASIASSLLVRRKHRREDDPAPRRAPPGSQ